MRGWNYEISLKNMRCQNDMLISIVMYIKSEVCLSIQSINFLFFELIKVNKLFCYDQENLVKTQNFGSYYVIMAQ